MTSSEDAQRYVRANRDLWNAVTPHHVTSRFYDVEGFKAGRARRRTGLDELEVALVGDVRGKTLLHLQCHFGIDTICWAQRGATVTGVDFASEAIQAARRLAAEMGVPATFVESDVYDLPANLQGRFDVVFTSHGVLGWLPDLERWGQVIARFLAPGGRFHLIEAHPFAWIFDDLRTDAELNEISGGERIGQGLFYGTAGGFSFSYNAQLGTTIITAGSFGNGVECNGYGHCLPL